MIHVRMANPPVALQEKFSEHERAFYFKYADIVHMFLNSPDLQEFIDLMIKEEKIDRGRIKDVRVMVFPFGSTEGARRYADYSGIDLSRMVPVGLYNAKRGIISIYPILTELTPSSGQLLKMKK